MEAHIFNFAPFFSPKTRGDVSLSPSSNELPRNGAEEKPALMMMMRSRQSVEERTLLAVRAYIG